MANEAQRKAGRRLFGPVNTLAAKAVILVLIFVACPLIVYVELRGADREKSALLVETVQEQGRLLALALKPSLQRFGRGQTPALQKELARVASGSTKIKILFRPSAPQVREKQAGGIGFFYLASWPEVPAAYLDAERQFLFESGLLDQLSDSCEGGRALALRYTNPAGEWELLSSVTPVQTRAGCWAILTAIGGPDSAGIGLEQPYWQSPEVRVAAAIYLIMALLVFSVFFGVWRNLRRFANLANDIAARGRGRASFTTMNRVPELHGVAREFDRMVDGLDASAKTIRDAAEENAHAFKTPIAVIAQSVDPIRSALSDDDERARRSLQLVEQATARLDALVAAARHMDEAIADLISPPRERIDLSHLLSGMVDAYGETAAIQGVVLAGDIDSEIIVLAGEDLLEIVIENLLDNAFSFAPKGSEISVTLSAEDGYARLVIADRGPGVDSGNLERIFDRYFSDSGPLRHGSGELSDVSHYGMGLWIVRRNVEAIGGTVRAANREGGGLSMVVRVPLAG